MFAHVSERKMLAVRLTLLLAWLVLIGSLIWDPVTIELTRPENTWSPFHIGAARILVQDQPLTVEPYALGARVFWAMAVPVLPMFLVIFGHEAWRRVCPLSFASQIPRYLGLQRRRPVLRRRTGQVERVPRLIGQGTWLQRNAWYVQIVLLYIGLCIRILFINSDRWALATALVAVILTAFTVGLLWGGKTWCNYFCPANIVQRIYTEPRGLLESRPHLGRAAVTQSMCRSPSPGGDRSACVACSVHCGDIDLERAYWETLQAPYRRHVYYAFLGLIIGFYGYYYLYAGSWDYYFSGVWTHEANQIGQLSAPGLYLANRPMPIPKWAAVPLVLAAAALLTMLLGKSLEALYRLIRRRRGALDETELVHHCLCFAAYLSINTFYVFGGRPNLNLLPGYGIRAFDLLAVSLTTMWLWQAVQRSPLRYRRESLASTLVEQLRKLKVNVGKHFDGRSLEQLKPDEIYVLAKVLPDVSRDHKIAAYRNVLDEAITTGKTNSPAFLETLRDLRTGMGIGEDEHIGLIDELGGPHETEPGARAVSVDEKASCVANYVQMLGAVVAGPVEGGQRLQVILASAEFRRTIGIFRASLQITEDEHELAIASLRGPAGDLARRIETLVSQLKTVLAARFCILSLGSDDEFSNALTGLIADKVVARSERIYKRLLPLLDAVDPRSVRPAYLRRLADLDGDAVARVAAQEHPLDESRPWSDLIDFAPPDDAQGGTRVEDGAPRDLPGQTRRDLIRMSRDSAACFDVLLDDNDPVVRALVLTACSYVDAAMAQKLAQKSRAQPGLEDHWLLAAVASGLASPGTATPSAGNREVQTRVSWHHAGEAPQTQTFTSARIRVGRAPANDIVIRDRGASPYHFVFRRDGEIVTLVRLDDAPVYVDGEAYGDDAAPISRGAAVSLGPRDAAATTFQLDWDASSQAFSLEHYDEITKLVWLSFCPSFKDLSLATLADASRMAEVRRYRKGAVPTPQRVGPSLLFVQAGHVDIVGPDVRRGDRVVQLASGDIHLLAGDAMHDGDPGRVEVPTPFAVVLVIRDAAMIERLTSSGGGGRNASPARTLDLAATA